MTPRLPPLPVLEALPALRRALERERHAVLSAPPGSGKTTVVPLALLDEPWLSGKKILVLEPRRLAARRAAERMAFLLEERVGETVGYRIRFEKKISAATRIEVITEGLLTRRLQSDPELPGVGLVIVDEFHERSLDVDLALALTLEARTTVTPELRVLVMSATLDTAAVSGLLGGAPVIETGGSLYPVTTHYRPTPPADPLDAALTRVVLAVLPETQGDLLAFLPGAREIRGAQRRLQDRLAGRVSLHPLYGDLPSGEQDAALLPARDGRRKVILATNIAQTSLTVEGVTTVVDSGYARVARFDLGAGANRLDTVRISRATAEQRAGRAGRLGPGACYRLWNREQHARLPAQDTPEILSADLTRLALELAAWGTRELATLALMDKPPAPAWSYAQELLRELGAVDAAGQITPHGRQLARLPLAPRLGHMLLLAQKAGLTETAAWIAALLDERGAGTDTADIGVRLTRFQNEAPRAHQTVAQFLGLLGVTPSPVSRLPSPDDSSAGRIVSWAFPERIARRRTEQRSLYLCEDGGEARLPEKDSLSGSEWLSIAHWDPVPPRKIRLAAPLSEAQVLQDHADRLRTEVEIHWDSTAQAVVAQEQKRLGALVLQQRPLHGPAVSEKVRVALLQGLQSLGLEALPWSPAARQWQARVLSLRTWRTEETWPDVSDPILLRALEQWLGPHLDGMTRREHLARLPLMDILNGMLEYPQQSKLARLAPARLTVPSGSHVELEYFANGNPPALAVKVQELFGWTTTPTVNEGRTRVVLHLLSPARRPVAVTQDLAGFWARTYPEVRKELKGRYPRHPWPENPLDAAPTRHAKRRR
ncbi:MAG: ATP-dependent helicase HrpB [Nevskiales bacterium]|nr:ATP-dependent helicase HrpB [Nevskiales bacterium]